MSSEVRYLSTAPSTDEDVDSQISLLCKHPLLHGDLRPHLLRFLVRIRREGRYAEYPRPIGKQILSEFYEFAASRFGIVPPKDPDLTGKKLVGELADALEKYYDPHHGPGAKDRIVIGIAGGRGSGYEPSIERRPDPPTPEVIPWPSARRNDAESRDLLRATEEWDQARFDQLVRQVQRGSEEGGDLWIVTTFFINYDAYRKTINECLNRALGGLRIRIIVMNPANAPLVRAKFKVRADKWKPEVVVPVLREQIEWLAGLRYESGRRTGTVEVRVSDLVPSGIVAHSRQWGVIGVMPATEPYLNGPMIEITDPDSIAWHQINEDWEARWNDAEEPVAGVHY